MEIEPTKSDVRPRRVILSMLVSLVVAVALFPELFTLAGVTPFTQLSAFRPQGSALLLILGLLMAIRPAWRIAGALIIALALVGVGLTVPRVVSSAEAVPSGTTELTVMAANVLGGGADATAVAELIRQRRPALVSLPEAQADVRQRIESHLQDLGYRGFTLQANAAVESATSVLVSAQLDDVRFDAEKVGAGDQTTTRFGHVIVTGGTLGKLRLIAYHGFPPLPSEVGSWRHDLQVLKGWCSTQGPTIVAGDFNATTDHAGFREALGSSCRSVAPSVGEGLQGTWPSGRPAVLRAQIDHVVVSDGVTPVSFTSYAIAGSDHRAAIAVVAVST